MPKVFTSNKQIIGKLGENLAKKFLIKHGYTILEENYTKKYGEIDLIAQKDKKTHFVEVKSIVSRETGINVPRVTNNDVSHETSNKVTHETYDPLENVHPGKLKRLSRVIQVYLVAHETNEWQFDVITVLIDQSNKIRKVKHIKDIVI